MLKSLLPNRLNKLQEVRIQLLFNWIGKSTKANHGTDSNPGTLVEARNKDFGAGLQRYLTRLVVLFVCSLPLASLSKKYLMKPQMYVYYLTVQSNLDDPDLFPWTCFFFMNINKMWSSKIKMIKTLSILSNVLICFEHEHLKQQLFFWKYIIQTDST